jgi:hypothetical protein
MPYQPTTCLVAIPTMGAAVAPPSALEYKKKIRPLTPDPFGLHGLIDPGKGALALDKS